MSFYYLSKEMGLALNDILGRVCSYNKDFSREDIAITWINYKSENKRSPDWRGAYDSLK